ncbi:type II toxin-antitoxin system HipA family toxin [Marinicella sediminis]|uniref:Type II toxin-antitoxin system HipA family toxin n=1 Tax=Marinicella sediminis TaxID=1792834 RepID=A0ABV7JAL2_9GAMM|nr:type II toxin-antitoxin system HipA family toxin [Marinicella sediminis]
MKHVVAEVRLWGEQVGALAYDQRTGICVFEYAPEWITLGMSIAPLTLPLPQQAGILTKYSFPHLNKDTFRGLPGVFADALPDDFGHAVIDAWLARQGRDVTTFTAVERLLYTGTRGMGALEFMPGIARQLPVDESLEMAQLVNMAQHILDQRAGLSESVNAGAELDAMQAILQVGTSAGGARAKAVIAINRSRTEIRSGQVPAPAGFEHYLLKFDGVEEQLTHKETFGDPKGYGRMEYAYYLMAKAAGIHMAHCELLEEGGRAHFMTRRFDRAGNQKLHYLSLCGMAHADYKKPGAYSYEALFGVARQLRLSRAEAIELYRRMVFNVVARNHDDHSKNFGFLKADLNASWQLSPAFDVAYSYRADSPWVSSHQLSINGKRDGFERADLLAVGKQINHFREAGSIIEEVTDVVSSWPDYAAQAGVEPGFMAAIQNQHRLYLTR